MKNLTKTELHNVAMIAQKLLQCDAEMLSLNDCASMMFTFINDNGMVTSKDDDELIFQWLDNCNDNRISTIEDTLTNMCLTDEEKADEEKEQWKDMIQLHKDMRGDY